MILSDSIYYTALVKSLYSYQVKPNERDYKKVAMLTEEDKDLKTSMQS